MTDISRLIEETTMPGPRLTNGTRTLWIAAAASLSTLTSLPANGREDDYLQALEREAVASASTRTPAGATRSIAADLGGMFLEGPFERELRNYYPAAYTVFRGLNDTEREGIRRLFERSGNMTYVVLELAVGGGSTQ